jgi:hypothetical protein
MQAIRAKVLNQTTRYFDTFVAVKAENVLDNG